MPINVISVQPKWHEIEISGNKASFLIKPFDYHSWIKYAREGRKIEDKDERWYKLKDDVFDVCLVDWKDVLDMENNPTPFSIDTARAVLPNDFKERIIFLALEDVNKAEGMFRTGEGTPPVAS